MTSAILTVLYPDDFTVYDRRVCDMLNSHHFLAGRSNLEARWQGYLEFREAVSRSAPDRLSLRDKDRYLWAQSRHEDLMRAVARRFKK